MIWQSRQVGEQTADMCTTLADEGSAVPHNNHPGFLQRDRRSFRRPNKAINKRVNTFQTHASSGQSEAAMR